MFKLIKRIIADFKYRRAIKKRLEEIRKSDPFIYD